VNSLLDSKVAQVLTLVEAAEKVPSRAGKCAAEFSDQNQVASHCEKKAVTFCFDCRDEVCADHSEVVEWQTYCQICAVIRKNYEGLDPIGWEGGFADNH
jgi:hypothetical protein